MLTLILCVQVSIQQESGSHQSIPAVPVSQFRNISLQNITQLIFFSSMKIDSDKIFHFLHYSAEGNTHPESGAGGQPGQTPEQIPLHYYLEVYSEDGLLISTLEVGRPFISIPAVKTKGRVVMLGDGYYSLFTYVPRREQFVAHPWNPVVTRNPQWLGWGWSEGTQPYLLAINQTHLYQWRIDTLFVPYNYPLPTESQGKRHVICQGQSGILRYTESSPNIFLHDSLFRSVSGAPWPSSESPVLSILAEMDSRLPPLYYLLTGSRLIKIQWTAGQTVYSDRGRSDEIQGVQFKEMWNLQSFGLLAVLSDKEGVSLVYLFEKHTLNVRGVIRLNTNASEPNSKTSIGPLVQLIPQVVYLQATTTTSQSPQTSVTLSLQSVIPDQCLRHRLASSLFCSICPRHGPISLNTCTKILIPPPTRDGDQPPTGFSWEEMAERPCMLTPAMGCLNCRPNYRRCLQCDPQSKFNTLDPHSGRCADSTRDFVAEIDEGAFGLDISPHLGTLLSQNTESE